jgi:hypothetical protein
VRNGRRDRSFGRAFAGRRGRGGRLEELVTALKLDSAAVEAVEQLRKRTFPKGERASIA